MATHSHVVHTGGMPARNRGLRSRSRIVFGVAEAPPVALVPGDAPLSAVFGSASDAHLPRFHFQTLSLAFSTRADSDSGQRRIVFLAAHRDAESVGALAHLPSRIALCVALLADGFRPCLGV